MAPVQQLILALLAGLMVAALFFALMFAAERIRRGRHLVHDVSGLLGIVQMANHIGDEQRVQMGFDMLRAIIDPDTEGVVKLRRLVKSVCDLVETPHGCELHQHLDSEISVRLVPRDGCQLLMNLLLNATTAACTVRPRQPVLVDLTDERLLIRNVAQPDSLAALIAGPGATTRSGNGHGVGRRSAQRSCDALGWTLNIELDGQFVITRVSGFVPVDDCATVDGEGGTHHA